jgi:vesicle-fusing ATPase
MPIEDLHMTTLEIIHSRPPHEIDELVEKMRALIPEIVNYTVKHRARVIKPMLGFDASAIALTFLPAAGEPSRSERRPDADRFTYHHLRRSLYEECRNFGIVVDSRYVVPTIHLTIGRFIKTDDFLSPESIVDRAKIAKLVETIEQINVWLKEEFWPSVDQATRSDGGEWVIGAEKGLDCRCGAIWYGGGRSIMVGDGF